MPSTAIKLPDELIAAARHIGLVNSRSVPRQIEYWARIGRIAEENPDLPYTFIRDALLGKLEMAAEKLEPYQFG